MGIAQSLPLPRYGFCIRPQNPNRCKENHSRVKCGHRRNLSAAFNFSEADPDASFMSELININTATEEELMTLSGINRQTAQNIIDYRRVIGGFRKVEDLALVSGVGATRLNHIRMELCVGKRILSKNSSTSSSGIDISMPLDNISHGSATATQTRSSIVKVNVNTSNVFQLMKVKLITQVLAENIVIYRDQKGPFENLDDLVKVKGIKPAFLSAIRPHLVLVNEELPTSSSQALLIRTEKGSVKHLNGSNRNSAAIDARLDDAQEELISRYGPLFNKSFRERKNMEKRKSCSAVRLVTWNLDQCGAEKADNPGVKEVFAMTLLENGLSLVAVQDLLDDQALQMLCDELNDPTLPSVKKWSGNRGRWKCFTSPEPQQPMNNQVENSYQGFLYDLDQGVKLLSTSISSIGDESKTFGQFFVGIFEVHSVQMAVISVHLQTNCDQPSNFSSDLNKLVEKFESEYKYIILAGYFGAPPDSPGFAPLLKSTFFYTFPADKFTDISVHNMAGTACTSNIWISNSVLSLSTGYSEIVRDGLTNPWIPNGWGWNGLASSHCPVWTELILSPSYNELQTFSNSVEKSLKKRTPTFTVGEL